SARCPLWKPLRWRRTGPSPGRHRSAPRPHGSVTTTSATSPTCCRPVRRRRCPRSTASTTPRRPRAGRTCCGSPPRYRTACRGWTGGAPRAYGTCWRRPASRARWPTSWPAARGAAEMRARGTLGVLGGMGPSATAEFLRLLAIRVPAETDQQHPRIVMLSDPAIPDRTAALLAGDHAPLAPIRDGLLTLERWGADLLAVPCNTAHAYIDRLREVLSVPIVHIVEETLREAMLRSPAGGWLTATTGTVFSGLYQQRADPLG